MDAKLVVVAGDTEATEVKLRLPAILGRGREATLTVPHPLVSRQHCEIFEKDGHLVARDLGSLNGTFIGDERVSEAVLRDGELLTVGTVTFRAVYCDDPNLSAPVRQEDMPDALPGSTPAAAEQPGLGIQDEGETERVQPPAAPVAEEDDAEFEQFLQAVDVEADSVDEEAAQVEVAATLDYSASPSDPEAEPEVDEVEEVDWSAEPAGPEDGFDAVEDADTDGGGLEEAVEEVEEEEQVEDVEEVEEVEEVKEIDEVDEVQMAEPAESKKVKTGQKASNDEDDELQSFFRDLDI